MKPLLMLLAILSLFAVTSVAADAGIALKLVAKKKYLFDGHGKTSEEYIQYLDNIAQKRKRGEFVIAPNPPKVNLKLQLLNTTNSPITTYVGGDANLLRLKLSGGGERGVITLDSLLVFPAFVVPSKAVTIAPGKTHEILVARLSDGFRGAARYVYWTGKGKYKLQAAYVLADEDGEKSEVLKSEPIEIEVLDDPNLNDD